MKAYMLAIKAEAMKRFPKIPIEEIEAGLKKNESFIKFCFDNGFSIHHVVHELSI